MTLKHNCCDLCDNEHDCEECETSKDNFAEKPRNVYQRIVDDSKKTLLEETLRTLVKEYRKCSVLGSRGPLLESPSNLPGLINVFLPITQ